ncbi:DUF1684 domain-containing protein [Streptomyces sp. NPDC057690]|uniref:DUF1684 domain-containing protein n=1 Tax=Streptomyces sp. NPDC057690 TaxID=3346214 RepID=UPI0036D21F13
MPNADGRERGLGPGGEPAFVLAGQRLALQVRVRGHGWLWAVFADATSGVTGCRSRFLHSGAPDADGRTTVDFHRAVLPPCACADAFLRPCPPPGNTYDVAVEAGERNLV